VRETLDMPGNARPAVLFRNRGARSSARFKPRLF